MLKKETITFALYVTVAVATTVHAAVEVRKTFREERKEAKLKKATEEKTA